MKVYIVHCEDKYCPENNVGSPPIVIIYEDKEKAEYHARLNNDASINMRYWAQAYDVY